MKKLLIIFCFATLAMTHKVAAQVDYMNLPLYSGPFEVGGDGIAKWTASGTTGDTLYISNVRFSNTGAGNNGHNLWITGSYVVVEYCFFDESDGLGIYIDGASNVIVRHNLVANTNRGFLAENTTGNVRMNYNQLINMQWLKTEQGCCRGQFFQFALASGSGNQIIGNRGVNFFGESYNEDLINTYGSNGTSGSPIEIRDNIFIGGGPSLSSGGILTGDGGGGGDYYTVEDNKLVDPGQYGFGAAGGSNATFRNNEVFSSPELPWNGIGFYALDFNSGSGCSDIDIGSTNKSNYICGDLHPDCTGGVANNFFTNGTCSKPGGGAVIGPTTGQTLASMAIPDPLITFISEDEIWQLRSRKVKYTELVANGATHPGVDMTRPTADAGTDQSVSTSTATLTSSSTATGGNSIVSYRWIKVSGPAGGTVETPTASSTDVNNLETGTYVYRLEIAQETDYSLRTYDADWMSVVVDFDPEPPTIGERLRVRFRFRETL